MKHFTPRFRNANTSAPPFGRGLRSVLVWLLLLLVVGPAWGQVPLNDPPIARMDATRGIDASGTPGAVTTGVITIKGESAPDAFTNQIGGVQIGQTCYVNYLGRNYIGDSVNVTVYDEFCDVFRAPVPVSPIAAVQSVEVRDPNGQLVSTVINSQIFASTNTQNPVLYNRINFTFTPVLKGEYTIDAFINGYDSSGTLVKEQHLRGILSNIPRIENVVLEMPSLCYTDFDKDYHFKVKTIPTLQSDILYYAADHTAGNTAPCSRVESVELITDVTGAGTVPVNVYAGTYAGGQSVSYLKSSLWQSPPSQSVIEDRYITSADLMSSGASTGNPLTVTVHVTDYYLYDQTFTVTIPIIWPGQPLPYDLNSYTVRGNEVWTPANLPASITSNGTNTIRIEKSLRVPIGTTLRLENMRIEFGPEGRMFIESDPGANGSPKAGYVKLVNSTLTAANNCGEDDGQWLGVQMQGDAKKSQSPFMNNPDWQGTLVMENSEISHASYAIDCWDGTWVKTGGRIRASNSRFLNNSKSVALYPYRNFNPNNPRVEWPYQARFSNCDFTVDETMPNGFIGFITANSVQGFRVSGCRFANVAAPTSGLQNGFGIVGNCGVVIDGIYTSPSLNPTGPPNIPTEFRNLKEAVRIGQLGNLNSYATVLNSNFYNCNVGVESDAVLGAITVRNNTFDLMEGVSFTPDKKKGVFINTGTGFLINNNAFDNSLNSRKSPGTTGVLVWKSGSTDNVVKNDIYKNIYTGDLSNFQNRGASITSSSSSIPSTIRGLKFLCSDHYNNPWDIAARGSNPLVDGINPLQMNGADPNNPIAAGNVFSYESSWEVANYPGEVKPLTYYYGPSQNQQPLHYPIGNVAPILTDPYTCSIAGPVYSPEAPIRAPQPVRIPQLATDVTPTERAESIAYYISDTAGMGSRDSLYTWLKSPGSDAYHTLMFTDMLIEDSNLATASDVYNSIVATHGLADREAEEFSIWGRKLLDLRIALQNSGRTLWQVAGSELDTLTLVAEQGTMWAKVRAQSWLTMLDPKLTFENEILYPYCEGDSCEEEGGQNKMAPPSAELPTVAQAAEETLSIAPNPTTGVVQVTIGTAAQLSLTDLAGRIVFTGALKEGGQEINLTTLPTGTYLYRIQTDAGTTFTGKLVKQ